MCRYLPGTREWDERAVAVRCAACGGIHPASVGLFDDEAHEFAELGVVCHALMVKVYLTIDVI